MFWEGVSYGVCGRSPPVGSSGSLVDPRGSIDYYYDYYYYYCCCCLVYLSKYRFVMFDRTNGLSDTITVSGLRSMIAY